MRNGLRVCLVLVMCMSFLFSAQLANASGDAASILSQLTEEKKAKTQPIEDPAGAMAPFYQALARTAAKQKGAITRICHFGDSLIEMELLPGPARRNLQKKWGDAGHGFILPSRPKPWYRPNDIFFKPAPEWICTSMHSTNPRDRRFGLGGAYGLAYKSGAKVSFGTAKKGDVGKHVSRFEILFPVEPQGGTLTVKVDGKKKGVINTIGTEYKDAYATIEVPDGAHQLQVIAKDKGLRMHGVILENGGPGVVYDALGINGSGVDTYLSANGEHWMNQLRHRSPDLVIIGLGTNDTFPHLDLKDYRRRIKKLVRRAREAVPDATILWMAPNDRAMKQGSKLITNPMTPRIVATQREVAKEMGIAFWSAFDAMGGEGSFARWYYAKPRLGAGDFFHPTAKGGEVLGELLYLAFMQGFAEYLEQNGMPGPKPERQADPLMKVEIVN